MDNDAPYRFKVGMCLQAGMPFTHAVSLARELGAKYGWFDIDFARRRRGRRRRRRRRRATRPQRHRAVSDRQRRLLPALPRRPGRRQADGPSRGSGATSTGWSRRWRAPPAWAPGAVITHAFLWPGNWSVWPMRWLSRGGVIAEIDMKRLVRVYEIVLERAERYDVDVVVGNLPWGYTASTENFRLLAERIGSRRLKFMWHPSDNLTCGEWDSATAGFRNIRPYLHSLHVKDLHVRPTDGIHRQDKDTDYRPIGEGDVDYPTILRSDARHGVRRGAGRLRALRPGGRHPRGRHAHQRREHDANGRGDRGRVAARPGPSIRPDGASGLLARGVRVASPPPRGESPNR